LWLVRNHPELKDAQIMRLVGTTKATLKAIRERTHWNSSALTPMDPVTLGLCSQIDLDFEVTRAAKDRPTQLEDHGQTLAPAEATTQPSYTPPLPRRTYSQARACRSRRRRPLRRRPGVRTFERRRLRPVNRQYFQSILVRLARRSKSGRGEPKI